LGPSAVAVETQSSALEMSASFQVRMRKAAFGVNRTMITSPPGSGASCPAMVRTSGRKPKLTKELTAFQPASLLEVGDGGGPGI
jgi:hypothetical protein